MSLGVLTAYTHCLLNTAEVYLLVKNFSCSSKYYSGNLTVKVIKY